MRKKSIFYNLTYIKFKNTHSSNRGPISNYTRGLLAEAGGREEAFQGAGSILCLDLKGGNTRVNMCKNPPSCPLQLCACCQMQLYLHRFDG